MLSGDEDGLDQRESELGAAAIATQNQSICDAAIGEWYAPGSGYRRDRKAIKSSRVCTRKPFCGARQC